MDAWVQSILSALVGGVIGGVAVGLTLQATSSPTATPVKADAAEAREPTADTAELEQRVRTLEGELQSLRRQSATARALGDYAKAMAAAEGDAGTHKLTPVVDAEDPVFELAVRSVYDRVEQERREERDARRAQRSEERAKWQADFVADRLQLSPEVRDRFQKVLVDQMERFQSLHNPSDGGAERPRGREQWRAQVDAIRKETDEKLSEVLTDQQLEEYKKLREQEGLDARGGRRGGRGR